MCLSIHCDAILIWTNVHFKHGKCEFWNNQCTISKSTFNLLRNVLSFTHTTFYAINNIEVERVSQNHSILTPLLSWTKLYWEQHFSFFSFSVHFFKVSSFLVKWKWPPEPSKLASMTVLVESLSKCAFSGWLNSVHRAFNFHCALLCSLSKNQSNTCAKLVAGL